MERPSWIWIAMGHKQLNSDSNNLSNSSAYVVEKAYSHFNIYRLALLLSPYSWSNEYICLIIYMTQCA